MVVTADRRELPAKVLLDDPRADLAVLKIDAGGERLPAIAIDDRRRRPGRRPGAGHRRSVRRRPDGDQRHRLGPGPLRHRRQRRSLRSSRPTRRSIPATPAAPLVDMNGDLIGVNTAILSAVGHLVRRRLRHPRGAGEAGGRRRRWAAATRWCGRGWASRPRRSPARSPGAWAWPRPQGVLVADVWPGGPAARAGLRPGRRDRLRGRPGGERSGRRSTTTSPPRRRAPRCSLVVRKVGGAEHTAQRAPGAAARRAAPRTSARIAGRNPLDGRDGDQPLAGRRHRPRPRSVRRPGRAGDRHRPAATRPAWPAARRLHPPGQRPDDHHQSPSWRRLLAGAARLDGRRSSAAARPSRRRCRGKSELAVAALVFRLRSCYPGA